MSDRINRDIGRKHGRHVCDCNYCVSRIKRKILANIPLREQLPTAYQDYREEKEEESYWLAEKMHRQDAEEN